MANDLTAMGDDGSISLKTLVERSCKTIINMNLRFYSIGCLFDPFGHRLSVEL